MLWSFSQGLHNLCCWHIYLPGDVLRWVIWSLFVSCSLFTLPLVQASTTPWSPWSSARTPVSASPSSWAGRSPWRPASCPTLLVCLASTLCHPLALSSGILALYHALHPCPSRHAFASTCVPPDTVRRRMMMTSGGGVKYKGSFDCFSQVLKNEGFMSLMKVCKIIRQCERLQCQQLKFKNLKPAV